MSDVLVRRLVISATAALLALTAYGLTQSRHVYWAAWAPLAAVFVYYLGSVAIEGVRQNAAG